MQGTQTHTWSANRARINGLWPKYEPTDAERELANQRLAGLRQDWLAAAVDSYRCECSSTVFRLAELLEHYRRIANAGDDVKLKRANQDRAAERVRERDALKQDREQCVAELRRTTRADVAAAVKRLRAIGWLSDRPLPPDVSEWTDPQVFMVCAALSSCYDGQNASAGRNGERGSE